VTSLLRRATFNMAAGNADAHAKNFSTLHEPDGPAVRLARSMTCSRPSPSS
jgi:serine/threonine protein kinase HipA of HipAB toxin-antitoxin module